MLIQTNRHGLPMPPIPTALLVVALIACIWAAVIFAAGYIVAAVGVAVCCAALGLAKRRRAVRER